MHNIIDRIVYSLAVLSAAAIGFIALIICYMVFMRYVFHVIPLWTSDITSFLLLTITFAGGAYVARNNAHTRVDILIRLIDGRPRLYIELCVAIFVCLVTATLAYFALSSVLDQYERGTRIVRSIIVQRWIILVPIFVGSVLVSLVYMQIAWGIWRRQLFPSRATRVRG